MLHFLRFIVALIEKRLSRLENEKAAPLLFGLNLQSANARDGINADCHFILSFLDFQSIFQKNYFVVKRAIIIYERILIMTINQIRESFFRLTGENTVISKRRISNLEKLNKNIECRSKILTGYINESETELEQLSDLKIKAEVEKHNTENLLNQKKGAQK